MDDDYMDNGRKEHTFLWFIDNYSYCWHKNGVYLYSPHFAAYELEATAWRLRLYPRGAEKDDKGYVCLCLDRSEEDCDEKYCTIKYVLSILAADGSTLCSSEERERTFKKSEGSGERRLIDEVFLRRVTDSLSKDTLTICCKMWIGKGNVTKFGKSSARTRIGIQKTSFLCVMKNFTELTPYHKITTCIKSPSDDELNICRTLYLGDKSYEGKLLVEISPCDKNHNLLKQKFFLIGGSGNIVECGEFDNRFEVEGIGNQKLPLSLTRQSILDKESEYLPNNELSVLCECTFSTGVELEKIEEVQYDLPVVALNLNCNVYKTAEKLSACTSVSEDFKALYVNQCLTDMMLKTKTKSFPAHKLILFARSSVFQAMLTSDMKEKNTDCIQVDDLEDVTVQQLLLFLYSDKLENLQWESAMKLYYAGDKYALEKLKVICASFLIDNLCPTTAGELLILADDHSDSDLKVAVEYFILNHEEEVYSSDEWKKLIETNSQLLTKTMHLKYKKQEAAAILSHA